MTSYRPAALRGFTLVMVGQLVSLLGTNMTGFGLTIWAYEKTGSATALALVGFFFITPMLIMSPIAGVIVDRHDRKFMMMISDLASGVATIGILALHLSGHLQIWHLYVSGVIQGTFQTFQWPAYSAAITTMLPKEHYGRANGMMSLAESGSEILAPLMAGALLGIIGLTGILSIDILTFLFAIATLFLVIIPQPLVTAEGQKSRGSMWQEAVYGFRYILARPGLLGLQIVFLLGNFFIDIAFAIRAPMILANTGNNELIFGTVSSIGAIGGLLGGLAMSAWGGTKKRVHGVLGGWALASLLGAVLMGFGRSLPLWAIASFAGAFFTPVINASNQSIWQAKVAPDLQGRVFSIRRLIAWFVNPLSMLIAGPLADYVFEPGMQAGGFLTGIFGWLVGIGPGRGMSLIFILVGFAAACVGISGYALPFIRDVETHLPDHDALPAEQEDRSQRLQKLLETRQHLLSTPKTLASERVLKRISQELRAIGKQNTMIE
jgi:DHA3 family macrolide efflux protein-like MFS transporter